jgi:bifunctional enzyme CysN/CysC
LKNFTGIDSAYQPPEAPELRLSTVDLGAPACAARVLQRLGLPD